MDRRKELKQQYCEVKIQPSVYQIKNTKNEKVFIESTMNLNTLNGKRFQLKIGGHYNKMLQQEWDEFGENAFSFEILEIVEKKEDGYFDAKEALKKLEKKWLDTLQPYDDRGYNRKKTP